MIRRVYDVVDGRLVPRDAFFDMQGWPPGESAHGIEWLTAVADRGGVVVGVFDGESLAAPIVGTTVVDTVPLGADGDLRQLAFLHVGRDHRDRGLGTALFDESVSIAREMGARGLYVSATPSEHTVGFYLARGCRLLADPDPQLFAREPEDVHLEYRFG